MQRWGLRRDYPLTAPAYSERRSTLAKSFGLGRKSTAQATPAVSPSAATPVSATETCGPEAAPRRKPQCLADTAWTPSDGLLAGSLNAAPLS
jgi:hypothetical protein